MIRLKNTHIFLLLVVAGELVNTAQAARRPVAPRPPGSQKPLPPMLPGTLLRDTGMGKLATAATNTPHNEYLTYSSRLQERTTRPSMDELKKLGELARKARSAEVTAHKAMGGLSATQQKILADSIAAKRRERESATIKTLTQKYSGIVRSPEERAAAESAKKAAELKARANIDFGTVTKPTDAGSSNSMARALQASRLEMESKRGTSSAKQYRSTKTAAELEAGSRASEARSKALVEKRAATWAAANTPEAIAARQAKRVAEAAKYSGKIDHDSVANFMAKNKEAMALKRSQTRGQSDEALEASRIRSEARSKALAEKRAIDAEKRAASFAAANTPEAIAARQAKRAAEAAKYAS